MFVCVTNEMHPNAISLRRAVKLCTGLSKDAPRKEACEYRWHTNSLRQRRKMWFNYDPDSGRNWGSIERDKGQTAAAQDAFVGESAAAAAAAAAAGKGAVETADASKSAACPEAANAWDVAAAAVEYAAAA